MNDTKKQLLNVAQHFVQERGYNGFSIQDLANEVQIKKASVFHHFASKEELVSSVLLRYQNWFTKWAEQIKTEKQSIWDKLNQLFEIYRYFRKKETLLCPISILSSEYTTLPKSIQSEIHDLLEQQENWIEEAIESAKKNHELSSEVDSKLLAQMIMTSISGSMTYSRLQQNTNRFESQLNFLIKQLKQYELKHVNT